MATSVDEKQSTEHLPKTSDVEKSFTSSKALPGSKLESFEDPDEGLSEEEKAKIVSQRSERILRFSIAWSRRVFVDMRI
jgi:hypothetical protein